MRFTLPTLPGAHATHCACTSCPTGLRLDMPSHGHDYDQARILHAKGFNIKQIADQTRIPYEALLKYAQRHKWTSARTKAVQCVSDHVQHQLVERSSRHLLNISGFADRAIDALITKDLSTMKLSDLQTLASVADTFDRIARRTYGLDAENASRPRVNVNVNVLSASTKSVGSITQGELVDVDALSVERVADAQSESAESSPAPPTQST